MKKVTLNLPAMYADHHVLNVRRALLGLKGVSQVIASSARKKVVAIYDESSIAEADIVKALIEAGYTPDQPVALPEAPKNAQDGSPWYTVLQRVTKTEMKDREMAGDFRRY